MTGSSRQQRAAAAAVLGSGGSRVDSARAAGVTPCTVSRWRKLPEFADAIERVRATASAAADGDVAALLDEMQRAVDASGRPEWAARAAALRLKLQLGLIGKGAATEPTPTPTPSLEQDMG